MPPRRTQRRKRTHAGVEPTYKDVNDSSKGRDQSSTHNRPGFWDELQALGGPIHLTRRALQEFDRRDRLLRSPSNHPARADEINPTGDLKRFARQGGPDFTTVRGYPQPSENSVLAMAPERSGTKNPAKESRESDTRSKKSGRSSAYDKNFPRLLIEHHIYLPSRAAKVPANFNTWKQRILRRRGSLTESTCPQEQQYKFLEAVDDAKNEAEVMSDVFKFIKGDTRYPSTQNRICYNWEPLWTKVPEMSDNLVTPQPDMFDGIKLSASNKEIREDLNGYIVPSTIAEAPFFPNFFLEAKSDGGGLDIARLQACHDGALGARGIHHVQNYRRGKEVEVYSKNAYTVSATYLGANLKIFLHHISQPDVNTSGEPHYHMTQVGSYAMDDELEAFHKGVAAFRNARDVAREYREQLLERAIRNPTEQQQPMDNHAPTQSVTGDSAMNAPTDEQQPTNIPTALETSGDSATYPPTHDQQMINHTTSQDPNSEVSSTLAALTNDTVRTHLLSSQMKAVDPIIEPLHHNLLSS